MQRLLAIALLLTATALPVSAQTRVSFDADAVIASGLTPGGKVAWLSVARERPGWITRVVRREGIGAADSKGEMAVQCDASLSANSGWFVVDLLTGEAAFGTPGGGRWRLIGATARAAGTGASGVATLLQDERQLLQVLLARPGDEPGAWGLSAGDGGESDDDPQPDGTIRARMGALRPVADSPAPPKAVRAGDVLVAIDPQRAEAYIVRVERLH